MKRLSVACALLPVASALSAWAQAATQRAQAAAQGEDSGEVVQMRIGDRDG